MIESCVGLYFGTLGSVNLLFHRQTFYRELNAVKERPQSVSPSFIVQIFLILSSVWCLNPDGSITPSMVANWIHWSETWLHHSGIKRPNITVLQVRCLLIQAKELNFSQRNQAWAATGNLVKLAMSAGLHREPPSNARISIFNREMRRRVWTTILELDLQASLDRGMPPTLRESDYDCQSPLNINDEDLEVSAAEFPDPKPITTLTDSSYQVAAAQSLGLRLRICALINSPFISISSTQLSELDETISRQISNIPDWETSNGNGRDISQRVILWRSLLQMHLQRSQLSQHSFCLLGGLKGGSFTYSPRARLEAAVDILCHQQLLLDQLGKRAWFILGEIIMQAAFNVCHHLYTSDSGFGTGALLYEILLGQRC